MNVTHKSVLMHISIIYSYQIRKNGLNGTRYIILTEKYHHGDADTDVDVKTNEIGTKSNFREV